MKLYNTLSRTKEELPPPDKQKTISFYACGPTVYDETHIGHMRKYTMDDILIRALEFEGYEVNHVMNITDVGHLTGDDDNGEDKLEKGAKKHGKTVSEVTGYYTDQFFMTMDALGVVRPDKVMKATEHIQKMIDLIKKLQDKGHVYETEQAVYFDVTTFPTYGQLSGQKLDEKKQAVRKDVYIDAEKKHPADFALWFKRVGRFADHTMHWSSPWGEGFPGWHIECSAMSMAALGETIDIHTGGIDHIPVHHENEIAQSEAATGKQFVKWWVHHAFLKVDDEKMSKSKGNFYSLKDIQKRNIDPLVLRYLFLQTHYRKELNFSWESIEAVQNALKKLYDSAMVFEKNEQYNYRTATEPSSEVLTLLQQFKEAIADDLNTSKALGILHQMLEKATNDTDTVYILAIADEVFGLQLKEKGITHPKHIIPHEIKQLAQQRLEAKQQKDFERSDALRKQIEKKGYEIEDLRTGYNIRKK